MKKSYLMLGLVAAALSSCSNDDPVSVNPNENQLPGTENLVPIRLSMSTTAADVEVGTRGTGTVGGLNEADNIWQFEDIYLLMTTNDTLCMQPLDANNDGVIDLDDEGKWAHAAWGFTSVRGKGPFLLEQFDGSFWARPAFISTNIDPTKDNVWTLDYTVDKNEWWYGAPIDKFYPQKGASQFFAYYIDDAVKTTSTISDALVTNGRTASHDYPTINKENGVMTVDFTIDGSQDLMAGYAKLPQIADNAAQKTLADQDGGFSAQSARADVIPQITMKHLLSRLTFEVVKGDANFDKVTLDGIQVMSKTDGQMVVAANVEDKEQTGLEEKIGTITWDNGTDPAAYKAVSLKQSAETAYKAYKVSSADASKNQLVTDEDALITFSYDANGDDNFDDAANGDLEDLAAYWTPEDGLYYLASKQEKVVLTAAQIETLEGLQSTTTGGDLTGYKVAEGSNNCVDAEGNPIMYNDGTNDYTVQWTGTTLSYNDGSTEHTITATDVTGLVEIRTPIVTTYTTATVGTVNNVCVKEDGTTAVTYSVYGQTYNVLWTSVDGVHYYKTITEPEDIPTGAVYSADRVVVYEKKDNTLENGKAKLIDFISLDLRDLNLVTKKESEDDTHANFGKEFSASVGEAMFVSPGDTEYKMLVKMTYLVREAQDNAISDEFDEGGALTEEITLPLTLKLSNGSTFQAGYSYNIKVTIYGLKEVIADVELTKWENGGDISVGEDDTVEDVTP